MNNVFSRENEQFVQSVNKNFKMSENIVQRLALVAAALGIKKKSNLAEKLGIGRTTLYYIENGDAQPSEQFLQALESLEQEAGASTETYVHSTPIKKRKSTLETRMIPVVGWAHAGDAASYEELPPSWQNEIPTECQDVKAFAVSLEGDSMEPRFGDGDLLIVQPSEQAYSGCYVVARFSNDGVIFRRLEMNGGQISLVPLNERYQVTTHAPEEFSWIYPVWGRWTQLWKR